MHFRVNSGLIMLGRGTGCPANGGVFPENAQIDGRFSSTDPIKYDLQGVDKKPKDKLEERISELPKPRVRLPPGAQVGLRCSTSSYYTPQIGPKKDYN